MIPALCDEEDEGSFLVARVIGSSFGGHGLSLVGPDAAYWRGINGCKAFRGAIGTKHCELLTVS